MEVVLLRKQVSRRGTELWFVAWLWLVRVGYMWRKCHDVSICGRIQLRACYDRVLDGDCVRDVISIRII